jgi:hypothetical protein
LEALKLWEFLGQIPNVEDDWAKIHIKKTLVGQSLSLYFVAQTNQRPRTWLNQQGIVCISLLCNDAEQFCSELKMQNFEVGACFELQPFDRKLKIFFMRNCTGEIYEFLSPA